MSKSVRFAVVIALALVTLGVPARTAGAEPRNACQDLLNQMEYELAMSRFWNQLAFSLFDLGYYDLAEDAQMESNIRDEFWRNSYQSYTSLCR